MRRPTAPPIMLLILGGLWLGQAGAEDTTTPASPATHPTETAAATPSVASAITPAVTPAGPMDKLVETGNELIAGSRYQEALASYEQGLALAKHANDRLFIGRFLFGIGNVYAGLSQHHQALDYHREALSGFRAIGDRRREGQALGNIGNDLAAIAQFPEALEHFQQALAIHRETGDRQREGKTLGNIGNVYANLAQFPQALEPFQLALIIFRDLGDRQGEGITLDNIGLVYDHLAQYPLALEHFQQALVIFRELGDRQSEGKTLNHLGIVYANLARFPQALEYHEQALGLFREYGNREAEGSLHASIGDAYQSLAQYPQAMEHLQQALAIAREVGDRLGEGKALNGIGQVEHHLGQYQRALDHYQRALAIFREVGDRGLEGNCLGRIGNAEAKLARHPQALDHHQQALAIFREVGDRQAEGAALGNIGNVDMSLARYPQALEHYQQALAIHRETGDRMGEGNDHSNIGTVYQNLTQYPQALEHHQLALTIDREAGHRPGEAVDLASLGSVYASLAQYPQALEHSRLALAIFRETGNRHQEGITLDTIARVALLQGQTTEAMPAIENALAIFRETGARREAAAALTTLAAAQSAQGQLQHVVTTLGEALTLAMTTADAETLRGIQDGLRRTLARQGQNTAAIFFGKQAVNTIQDLRGRLANTDQAPQPSLLGDKDQVYRGLANLLLDQRRLDEAVQVLAMLKEEELYDYQSVSGRQDPAKRAGTQAAFSKAEAPWRDRYQRISGLMSALGQEIDALQDKKKQGLDAAGEARLRQLNLDLQAGSKTIQAFLDELRASFTRKGERPAVEFGELERKRLTEPQGTLKKLGKGVVLVHTLVTDERLRMVLTTAKDPPLLREGDVTGADLCRKIGAFRAVLTQPIQDPRPLGRELYQWLMAPLALDLRQAKASVIMVSLDDCLRYLPLAALHDGRHYLVEDYALAIFTPAAPAHLPVHSQGGLATRPQDAPVHHLRVAGLGLSELNDQVRQQGFAALPAVVAELDGLVREQGRRDPAGVLPGVKYLNREFTPTRLSEVLRESFAVVHLATPCRFEPGGDTDSFLLLGDGGQERLTLGAFRSVDYPLTGVDLLTLSACQTTMGQTTMGEKHASGRELEGFGAMTRNQGAQTVLTSLWPVADASRALFMERFYQLRQDRHLSKAEALRQAQLTLLGRLDATASPPAPAAGQELEARLEGTPDIPDFPQDQARPHAHPYYWAPFILMGNWL